MWLFSVCSIWSAVIIKILHVLMWNKKPTRCHLVLYLFLLISCSTKWHLVGFLFHIELRCTVNHTSKLHGLFQHCNHPLHTFLHMFNVMQQAMYEAVVDYWENRGRESGPEEVAHLGVITALKKICNHPSLVIFHQSEQLPGEVGSHTTCRCVQSWNHNCSVSSNR